MSELRNDFAWSWSRYRTFRTCRREYWYNHHGAWGAWRPTEDEALRELYIQKKLTTQPQWLGTLVHEAAEWVLKEAQQGRVPSIETVAARYIAKAEREIQHSEQGLYRFNALKYTAFSEHYYGTKCEPKWDATVRELIRQVRGLFDNKIFRRLLDVPGQIREVERLEQIRVGDVPVWVSIDVLVQSPTGGFVVIDWKTGRHHTQTGVAAQLGVYGLYVADRYLGGKGDLRQIKTIYANLRTGEHTVWTMDPETLHQARDRILSSAKEMQSLEDVADDRALFPMLPEGSPACDRCRFRRTCGREPPEQT